MIRQTHTEVIFSILHRSKYEEYESAIMIMISWAI